MKHRTAVPQPDWQSRVEKTLSTPYDAELSAAVLSRISETSTALAAVVSVAERDDRAGISNSRATGELRSVRIPEDRSWSAENIAVVQKILTAKLKSGIDMNPVRLENAEECRARFARSMGLLLGECTEEKLKDGNDGREMKTFLKLTLQGKEMRELLKQHLSIADRIEATRRLLSQSPHLQAALDDTAHFLRHVSDHWMALALIRRASAELTGMRPAFRHRIVEGVKKSEDNEARLILHTRDAGFTINDVPGARETHATRPLRPRKTIAERIDANFHVRRLEHLQKKNEEQGGEWDRMAAYERMIIAQVYAEVSLFDSLGAQEETISMFWGEDGPDSVIDGAMPRNLYDRGTRNCFTGPWLAGQLLQRCGFTPDQLFLMRSFRQRSGDTGTHGTLLIRTRANEMLLMDPAFQICSKEIRLTDIDDPQERAGMSKVITNSSGSAMVYQPSLQHCGIHSVFQILPFQEGVTSGHLTHTAITFMEEGKLTEAEHAAQIALSVDETNPEALHCLGYCRLGAGDLARARVYFERALKHIPIHLPSICNLIDVALREKDAETVRKYLPKAKGLTEHYWRRKQMEKTVAMLEKRAKELL